MTERLDRIEAILERNAEQMAQSQQRHDTDFARISQLQESNARSIEANSNAIAELRQSQAVDRADFRASVEDMVSTITSLAEQAEQDRVEFRGTVQNILDALTQSFSGNGHGT
jgi:hypothetical protein